MKCPKCGSLNPDTRPQCKHCDTPLQILDAGEVPDWRKEVAEKVKAYGDRKRHLTTPPGPIKQKAVALEDQPVELPASHLTPPASVRSAPPVKPPAEPSKPRPDAARMRPAPTQAPLPDDPPKRIFSAPVIAPVKMEIPQPKPVIPPAPMVRQELEAWSQDIQDIQTESEEDEGLAIDFDSADQVEDAPDPEFLRALGDRIAAAPSGSAFFGKRAVAFVIDHVLLIGLYSTLVYLYASIMQDDIASVVQTSWPALIEIFLAAHLLYYLYFYKTSRQTPGQVFFAIELRDPGSVYIPIHKILIRWLVSVLLSILNPLPLLFGKDRLLMDELSGTEIRSLK